MTSIASLTTSMASLTALFSLFTNATATGHTIHQSLGLTTPVAGAQCMA